MSEFAASSGPPPPPGSGQPAAPEPTQPVTDKDARMWGMLCHLAGLAGYFIPYGNIFGPLVVWLIKKDEYPFVNDQGKEALNFQITVSICITGLIVLGLAACGIGLLVTAPLAAVVGVTALVFTIIAAITANGGVAYRYPLTIRLIK